ncbi:hypothetical protein [Halalkalibacterium halodurans]|uniref:Uncharacterized protein n=1 Tax=Halalkalibacterium halodurans TaxID=86665 RepID=A0A0M0KIT7_ALKHA|nr:hypothetical protein [Halalkalibacterium halodurans]TPE67999.1 hypothetical protein AMD02_015675 [Halalkalibacterium halodurans]
MSTQITKAHLDFLEEARKAFQECPRLETYRDDSSQYIALRRGEDRDCIEVLELQNEVALFVQQVDPTPHVRAAVRRFSIEMERQLKVNDHKGGWKNEHHEFLFKEMARNINHLADALKGKSCVKDRYEITIRCANIANYAMMIVDNEGERL